jgi:hypothetical protein
MSAERSALVVSAVVVALATLKVVPMASSAKINNAGPAALWRR